MSNDIAFKNHSIAFVVIGTLILWVCWLFFNAGSTRDMYTTEKNGPAKIIMNTILAGTAGGISGGILRPILM